MDCERRFNFETNFTMYSNFAWLLVLLNDDNAARMIIGSGTPQIDVNKSDGCIISLYVGLMFGNDNGDETRFKIQR